MVLQDQRLLARFQGFQSIQGFADGLHLGWRHPCDESQFAGGGKAPQDRCDLLRALVFAPDGLHHAQPLTAAQVEAGVLGRTGVHAGPACGPWGSSSPS